ncbi:MAG TPA: cellulase family glycosylhydrolase, partial [Acidimicrobiales bacterium]|nr:cellulase family glycosylhydrolase [Acidimicrobiales bacterium]
MGGRTASASGSATIGQRAGFAPTSWMLLWGSNTDVARDLDAAAATGAKLLRFDFDWQSAEPSKGSYNWSYIDRVVNGAKARGLSVLGTIAYTPAWARPSGTTDKVPPTNLGDYVNFVRAVVNRYAPQGLHQWEIWNEPNIVQFWQPKPDPANYTSMLKQSYAAIKAIDPSATVVSAGLAPAGDSSDGQYVSPR